MVFGATKFRVTSSRRSSSSLCRHSRRRRRRRRILILNSFLAPTLPLPFPRPFRFSKVLTCSWLSLSPDHSLTGPLVPPRRGSACSGERPRTHTYLPFYFLFFSEAALIANCGWSDVDALDYCYNCKVTQGHRAARCI